MAHPKTLAACLLTFKLLKRKNPPTKKVICKEEAIMFLAGPSKKAAPPNIRTRVPPNSLAFERALPV